MRALVVVVLLASACDSEGRLDLLPPCGGYEVPLGLDVQISIDGAPLAPDFYELAIDADDTPLSITKAIQPGTPSTVESTEVGDWTVVTVLGATAGEVSITDWITHTGPVHATVSLRRNGVSLGEADFTPDYHPQLDGCGIAGSYAQAGMIVMP